MSSSNTQRMRRMASVSPGSGKSQGPMRATMPFNLMRQSPTIPATISYSLYDGPLVKSRRSPETCKTANSPERTRPASPCSSKEKWRSVSGPKKSSGSSSVAAVHRTSSLDAIYLAGQWPRDCPHTYCGRPLLDKGTQTPDGWDEVQIPERRKALPPRSHSAGTGDQLEKAIRHRLPRSSASKDPRQRFSPISQPAVASASSRAIAVPASANLAIPKQNLPRMRSSVEGFNQEIEKHFSGNEEELQRVSHPTPDGHRAPIADMMRNNTRHANTQTPLGGVAASASKKDEEEEVLQGAESEEVSSGNESGANSRCPSDSPPLGVPASLEEAEYEEPKAESDHSVFSTPGDSQQASPELDAEAWLGTSPRINKFLAREPPDGCERVRIEEIKEIPTTDCAAQLGPKPCVNFILKPSSPSAFYPLSERRQPQSAVDAK